MEPAILQIISTSGGWAVAIGVAVIALVPRKGSLENNHIDQLQEDLTTAWGRLELLTIRIDAEERRNALYRKRDIAWHLHYARIQVGVSRGEIPPWPDLPDIIQELEND